MTDMGCHPCYGRVVRDGWFQVGRSPGLVLTHPKAPFPMSLVRSKSLNDLAQAERFQLLIEAVMDYAIYLLDAEGHIATWNPGAQRFKGYSAEEIIGKHFSIFYTPEDREAGVPAHALATARTEGKYENEAQRVRKNGERFWAQVGINPIRGEDGEVIGFAKITRDITERRQMEAELAHSREQLVQAQKMEAIGRLTGGVAHDFNNLLTVIRSSADFLRRPGLDEDKRKRYIDAIAETADRAATLTSQLLAFARRQPLRPEIFDLSARLRGLQHIISTTVGSSVGVSLDLPEEPLMIEADASQFETAVLNMVINARDAMPRGGAITIAGNVAAGVPSVRGHAPALGDFIAVSIADTGTGMAPDTLTKIFEPFFTTKPVDKGTGLGLSQVYGFAKQSRGEIDVASTLDVGTTFTLYLPRATGVATPTKIKPLDVDLTSVPSRRILLVEDNEGVGRFAEGLLKELGQTVVWVGDGQKALDTLAERRAEFDLVFSDIVMPGISGVELGRAIRARWSDLEVILTTGYSHALVDDAHLGFELLRKPYSVEGLLEALRQDGSEEHRSELADRSVDRTDPPTV